jgi:hypothetical protein
MSGQAQQLRAEIDRLSGLERRYRDALQAVLAEQQRLLEQRIPFRTPPRGRADLCSRGPGLRRLTAPRPGDRPARGGRITERALCL